MKALTWTTCGGAQPLRNVLQSLTPGLLVSFATLMHRLRWKLNRRALGLAHVLPHPRPCGSFRHHTACLHKAANRPRVMVCHWLVAHVLLEVFVDASSLCRRL